MKVKELIEMLQECDEDMEVFMSQPTHDYWGNVKAESIVDVGFTAVEYSNYHESLVIVEHEDMEEDEEGLEDLEYKEVLIIF